MTVGQRIKAAREKAGMTQAELAGECGLATITVQQYERDKRQPRFEQLQQIADALNVNLVDLVPVAARGSVDNGSRREGGSIKTGKEDLSMTGKEDFRMNNHINLTVRAFPVTVMDERTGETRADRIVLTREQLQAAQLVGESSTELIYRCFNRRGFKVLEIRKPVKREVVVSIYANEKSIYVGGAAALEETEAAEE